MAKKKVVKKTALQKAADAVQVMETAVADRQRNLNIANATMRKAELAFDQAKMDAQDSALMLTATQDKLNRELARVQKLINPVKELRAYAVQEDHDIGR